MEVKRVLDAYGSFENSDNWVFEAEVQLSYRLCAAKRQPLSFRWKHSRHDEIVSAKVWLRAQQKRGADPMLKP